MSSEENTELIESEVNLSEEDESISIVHTIWKNIKQFIFSLFFLSFIIVDMIIFKDFNNWGCPVSILILELIFLLLMGRWAEIEYLGILTEKVFNFYSDNS